MLYLRMCFDCEDSGDMRSTILKRHREYVASFIAGRDDVKIVQGGPMCSDEACDRNIGSFLIVDAASHDAVCRFHENDPFTKAGLFSKCQIIRWDRHIGNENQERYVP